MKEQAILLLHGFKRNGVDDFKYLNHYFESYSNEYDIYNEIYFDNYDRETIKGNHLKVEVNRIVDKLKEYKKVIIVGYSTGAIIAGLVDEQLPKDIKVYIYAIAPPINILYAKWVLGGIRNLKKTRRLKKKIGKERYNTLKVKQLEQKKMEKYPVMISIYINNLRLKYRSKLLKNEHTRYLLSNRDTFVKTSAIIKKLMKHNRGYNVKSFEHENILNTQRQIFKDWIESNELSKW